MKPQSALNCQIPLSVCFVAFPRGRAAVPSEFGSPTSPAGRQCQARAGACCRHCLSLSRSPSRLSFPCWLHTEHPGCCAHAGQPREVLPGLPALGPAGRGAPLFPAAEMSLRFGPCGQELAAAHRPPQNIVLREPERRIAALGLLLRVCHTPLFDPGRLRARCARGERRAGREALRRGSIAHDAGLAAAWSRLPRGRREKTISLIES